MWNANRRHLRVATTSSGVIVWNLLTSAVQWQAPIKSCAMSADPQNQRFALAVPGTNNSLQQAQQQAQAQAEGQQQQQGTPAKAGRGSTTGDKEGAGASTPAPASAAPTSPSKGDATAHPDQHTTSTSTSRPQPCCHVLVFDPASPAPKFFTTVQRASSISLFFATPDMPQAALMNLGSSSGSGTNASSISPLLVLTEERAYAYVLPPDAPEEPSSNQPSDRARIDTTSAPSAFEAAFGKLAAGPAAAAAGGGATAMDVDGDVAGGARPKWQALFDAPSHALPPPTVLAQAFLRLITSEAAGEEDA